MLRSKGGFKLNDSVFWLYSWDGVEIVGEPSADALAVEVKLDASDSVTAIRAAPITAPGPHLGARIMMLHDRLILAGNGICFFDLKLWKEVAKVTDGEGRISNCGNLYWGKDGVLSKFDPFQDRLLRVGGPELGYLVGAYSVGSEDVMLYEHGLYKPDIRASYRFPGPDKGGWPNRLFLIPNVGIGYLSDGLPKNTPGVFLSLERLTAKAMIKTG